MNLTKRIALHPWTPRIMKTLLILLVSGQVLLTVTTIRVTAETSRDMGFQECQQAQPMAASLRLEFPATSFVTDENDPIPWPYLLPGDLNNDCEVTVVDIMLVAAEWGRKCGKVFLPAIFR